MERVRGRWARFGALSIAAAGGLLAPACILIDPPDALPVAPRQRPTIRRDETIPPGNRILLSWPAKFVIPVETRDEFAWAFFVDYDPFTRRLPVLRNTETPAPGADAGVQVVELSVSPPDATRCHVVELVVARELTPASEHTPSSVGGDVMVWFYNPSGDPGACPGYQGIPGPDASADAASDTLIVPESGGGP